MSDQIASLRQRLRGAPASGMTAPAPVTFAQAGLLSRLFARAPAWVRRHERFPCCVIAVLDIADKGLVLEGLVTEISQGGVLFRGASHFVFDRRGSAVIVRFADDEIGGTIVNVKSAGYGIQFDDPVTAERVQDILDRFGLPGQQPVQ